MTNLGRLAGLHRKMLGDRPKIQKAGATEDVVPRVTREIFRLRRCVWRRLRYELEGREAVGGALSEDSKYCFLFVCLGPTVVPGAKQTLNEGRKEGRNHSHGSRNEVEIFVLDVLSTAGIGSVQIYRSHLLEF